MVGLLIGCSMCPAKLGRSLREVIDAEIDPHEAAALEASERELLLSMAASLGARP